VTRLGDSPFAGGSPRVPDRPTSSPPAELLRSIFDAAVAGAQPRRATERAVARLRPSMDRVWIIALGKAAHAMAAGAVDGLGRRGAQPVGGIVIAADAASPPHAALETVEGNHPLPGVRSLVAARRLGELCERVEPGDEVLVLLSGGASSLAGAPIEGVTTTELAQLNALLLGSGADIGRINAARKRFSRWGAGRLAAALAPAHVDCLVVSDVVGDDVATIGSGPCVGDATTARALSAWLRESGLWEAMPPAMTDELEAVERGERAETPKPGDPALRRVTTRVILGNRDALRAAAARAAGLGVRLLGVRGEMRGEAARRGELIAGRLVAARAAFRSEPRGPDAASYGCVLWGGETTVTLGSAADGALGGRCQELSLAAARALYALGDAARGVTLLAAGTDGRDGPTDAAGAIVNDETWQAVRAAGRNPARDLAAHDSHRALDAAGALVRTGLTGTNVTDVVVGLVSAE